MHLLGLKERGQVRGPRRGSRAGVLESPSRLQLTNQSFLLPLARKLIYAATSLNETPFI